MSASFFAIRDDIFKICDFIDHGVGLGVFDGIGAKVLADAVFEHLSLAHIDDRALFIAHDIHAGAFGQRLLFFFQNFA